MSAHIEIMAIAVVVSVACALPGSFLVLRRQSLLSDAISHAVLPGIVIGFFLTENINSPLLMAGAVASGLLTAWVTELLTRTNLVKEDAAIGLVFPILFSTGVILVSRYAGNVHLDTDAVLLGELAFAPFERFHIAGKDVGPLSLWVMSGILALNLVMIFVFFKEFKLSTFDPGLARIQGFNPALVHYGLMTLVSITVVGAFDSVGSILVVALMIAPPVAAALLTDRLSVMIILASLIGAVSAVAGYGVAAALDVSIAGAMASMCGLTFLLVWLFAPGRGVIALRMLKKEQKMDLGVELLVVHLSHHGSYEGGTVEQAECRREHLTQHINWTPAFAEKVTVAAIRRKLVNEKGSILELTSRGLTLAKETMTR